MSPRLESAVNLRQDPGIIRIHLPRERISQEHAGLIREMNGKAQSAAKARRRDDGDPHRGPKTRFAMAG